MFPNPPEFLVIQPPASALVANPSVSIRMPNEGWWRIESLAATVNAAAAAAAVVMNFRVTDAQNRVQAASYASSGVAAWDGSVAWQADVSPFTPTVDTHDICVSAPQQAINCQGNVTLILQCLSGADVAQLDLIQLVLRRVK